MKKLWQILKRKENWESRKGWKYFALLLLGNLIVGLGSLF